MLPILFKFFVFPIFLCSHILQIMGVLIKNVDKFIPLLIEFESKWIRNILKLVLSSKCMKWNKE